VAIIPEGVREYFRQEGARGGRIGGRRRAANLTAEQRRESARKAARARWAKRKKRTT
jgi:hypothetical protein